MRLSASLASITSGSFWGSTTLAAFVRVRRASDTRSSSHPNYLAERYQREYVEMHYKSAIISHYRLMLRKFEREARRHHAGGRLRQMTRWGQWVALGAGTVCRGARHRGEPEGSRAQMLSSGSQRGDAIVLGAGERETAVHTLRSVVRQVVEALSGTGARALALAKGSILVGDRGNVDLT